MSKTFLYRLLKLGSLPSKLRPILETEGMLVCDEGMGGWYITKNVKGPGKRYINRKEGFSGTLAVTQKRIVAYTYWKRQIHIEINDPKMAQIFVDAPDPHTLILSFNSETFRQGWQGIIEFCFRTDKAQDFYKALIESGASKGRAK